MTNENMVINIVEQAKETILLKQIQIELDMVINIVEQAKKTILLKQIQNELEQKSYHAVEQIKSQLNCNGFPLSTIAKHILIEYENHKKR